MQAYLGCINIQFAVLTYRTNILEPVLNATIRHLESLHSHFAESLRDSPDLPHFGIDTRVRKEVLMTARVLISKLRWARCLSQRDFDL